MIWRAFCGFVLGLAVLGVITTIGTAAGLPEGPGWWVVGAPLLTFMTYAGAITK